MVNIYDCSETWSINIKMSQTVLFQCLYYPIHKMQKYRYILLIYYYPKALIYFNICGYVQCKNTAIQSLYTRTKA